MLIGIGCTVPEIVNLPGQSGGEEAALDYSLASACNNNSAFSPSQATPSGGVFSATPSGLNINSSTGEVTPVGSTPQAYVIAYTVGGSTSSFDLTIKPLDNATFSYSASSFPQDASNPSPVFPSGAITGGTFSGTTGLVINSTTGEIDLSASTVASHTVTYNTGSSGSSVCPNTSTFTVAITAVIPALAQVSNVYSMNFDGVNGEVIMFNNSIDLGVNSTISLWANFSSTLNFVILGETSYTAAYLLYINATEIRVRILGVVKSFPHSISADQWYNIVIVRQGDSIEVFQNGNSLGTKIGYASSTTTKFNIIGSNSSASNPRYPVNGFIDEVGLFNTALTDAEVLSIYNATEVVAGVNKTADLSQLTTPPVKWYRMGD
jgi:hypothetical protein